MRLILVAACLVSFTGAPAFGQTAREHLDAMRHLALGQEAMHAEHWDNARAEFKAAIRLEPMLEMAHYGLGQVYMATKRFPEAVSVVRRVPRGAPRERRAEQWPDGAAPD